MSNKYTILMKLSCKCIKPNTRHGHDYEENDDFDDDFDGADADDSDDGADEDGGNFVTGVHLVCAGSCYRLGFMLTCLGGLQIQQWNVDHQEDDDGDGDDDDHQQLMIMTIYIECSDPGGLVTHKSFPILRHIESRAARGEILRPILTFRSR